MRSLAQIAKEQIQIASMYFHSPIIKSKEPYTYYPPSRNIKRNGGKRPKVGAMKGQV